MYPSSNFYEVWIASFCCVSEAKKRTRMSQLQLTFSGYLKDHRMIAKLHLEVHRVADDEAIKYFLLEFVLM